MTPDAFAALVGPTVHHVTREPNLPGIAAHGLMRACSLAALAGIRSEKIALRADLIDLEYGFTARLTHQRPLLAGRGGDFLEGLAMRVWAARSAVTHSPRAAPSPPCARALTNTPI